MRDPDVAWHIASGELIWQNLSIPKVDVWTYSADQVWYNLSYTWDAVIYLIYHHFGEGALFWMQAFLFAVVILGVYISSGLYGAFSMDVRNVVTGLSAMLIWDLLYLRPQILAYVLAMVAMYMLERRRKVGVFLIMILWVNLHGSFIVMYTLVGSYLLKALHNKSWQEWKEWVSYAFVICIATIINPIGIGILPGILRTLDSVVINHISEWLPFWFGNDYGSSMLIAVLILLGGSIRNECPIEWKISGIAWLLMSLLSQRSFGFFAVLGVPYTCYALCDFIEKYPSRYPGNLDIVRSYKIAVVLLLCAISIRPFVKLNLMSGSNIPRKAALYINEHCNGARVFNDYNIGGYLALLLKNNNKYFIDGRAGTAFSEELLEEYLKATRGSDEIESLMKRHDADVAILNRGMMLKSNYVSFFSKWRKIYADETYTLYYNPQSRVCKYEE